MRKTVEFCDYSEFPVDEVRKLYLCKAAHEKALLRLELLQLENQSFKAEIVRLNKIIAENLTLIT